MDSPIPTTCVMLSGYHGMKALIFLWVGKSKRRTWLTPGPIRNSCTGKEKNGVLPRCVFKRMRMRQLCRVPRVKLYVYDLTGTGLARQMTAWYKFLLTCALKLSLSCANIALSASCPDAPCSFQDTNVQCLYCCAVVIRCPLW